MELPHFLVKKIRVPGIGLEVINGVVDHVQSCDVIGGCLEGRFFIQVVKKGKGDDVTVAKDSQLHELNYFLVTGVQD